MSTPDRTPPANPVAHLKRPALVAVLGGFAFAMTLAFAHKSPGPSLVGVIGAMAFCMTASMRGPSPRRIATLFALPMLAAHAWLQNWLIGITVPGYLGLVALMAGFSAVAMWLAVRTARRAPSILLACLGAGALLAAMDFFRGRLFFTGYPWYTLGQPTLDILGVPTLASLIGMHGVNTLLCLLGALLAYPLLLAPETNRGPIRGPSRGATRGPARTRGVLVLVGVCIPVALAGTVTRALAPEPSSDDAGVPVAVVQTNVPQSNKQFATHEERIDQFVSAARMTQRAHAQSVERFGEAPAFIAWPETMFPGAALNRSAVETLRMSDAPAYQAAGEMRDALLGLQASLGAPMLVGAMALESPRVVPAEEEGYVRLEHDGSFNSVFLVRDGSVDEARYDKMHLTPFGEVMPFISRFDWLERQLLALGAPGMSFDLEAGDRPVRFDVGAVVVATPICFEATMAHVCRRLVFEGGERRASLLLNATNDGWFGSVDAARRDHLLLARWRAAELATPVIRAANTGISCFIDAKGRVYSRHDQGVWKPGRLGSALRGPIREEAVLLARVTPGTGSTLYARTGDAVGWAVFILGLGLAVFAVWPAKNRANHAPAPNAVEPTRD